MAELREGDLAWHLVEEFRDCLTAAELTTAFVDLGVGDYTPVIHAVLRAVARAREPLPPTTAISVRAWMNCYDQRPPAGIVLAATTQDQPFPG